MSEPKLIRQDRATLREAQVVDLRMRRKTYGEIGVALGISAAAAFRTFQKARRRFEQQSLEAYSKFVALEIAATVVREREAWKGWERSQQPKETKSIEDGPNGKRTKVQQIGQAGDPSFLLAVDKAQKTRMELMGLLRLIASPEDEQEADQIIQDMHQRTATVLPQIGSNGNGQTHDGNGHYTPPSDSA